jgi:hypothetical protein
VAELGSAVRHHATQHVGFAVLLRLAVAVEGERTQPVGGVRVVAKLRTAEHAQEKRNIHNNVANKTSAEQSSSGLFNAFFARRALVSETNKYKHQALFFCCTFTMIFASIES